MSAWETSEGKTDEWYTPAYVFEALGCRFDLDVAAAPEGETSHVPALSVIRKHDDGLAKPWSGFVWMNPPFGVRHGLFPWLQRFFAHGNGIALTPDRTSAPWFRFAWSQADLVLFMPKIAFEQPIITAPADLKRAPGTGTALWAAGGQAIAALINASRQGYGILATPFNRHEATKVMTFKQRLRETATKATDTMREGEGS